MKCEKCGDEDNVVMSGVDAFILECMEQIERICYPCANAQLKERKPELFKQVEAKQNKTPALNLGSDLQC